MTEPERQLVVLMVRRDLAADWAANNPVLESGVPGLETDTRYVKYGDGVTAWNDLGYSSTALPDVLEAIGELVPSADTFVYFTGPTEADLATVTAYARGLLEAIDAPAARVSLGLVVGTDVQPYAANLSVWAGKSAPSGGVVGTSDTQTLTNKALTLPTINGVNLSGMGVWTRSSGQPSLRGVGDFVLDGNDTSGTLFLNAYCSGDVYVCLGGGTAIVSGKALRLPPQASDPPSPTVGDTYYNSSTGKFRGYTSSGWVDFH